MADIELVEVDGSMLEGGGQILRMTAAFSVLLQKPVRINNIRAGRSPPGLKPQHLKGLQLLADMCQGNLVNASVGSTSIDFWPGTLRGGDFRADPGTAGSISLLLQVSLPCALYAPSPVRLFLRGGTDVDFAPPMDFVTHLFKPTLAAQFGVDFQLNVVRRGYFPKGGGQVEAEIPPLKGHLQPCVMEEAGKLEKVSGRAFVVGTQQTNRIGNVAKATADAAMRVLKSEFGHEVEVKIEEGVEQNPSVGKGTANGILLVGETSTGMRLGGGGLAKRGQDPRDLGKAAAEELLRAVKSKSCVDEYLQDQLVIFMALAKGESRVRTGPLTLHTKTAIHVAQLLTSASFDIQTDSEGNCVITCQGIGHSHIHS